MNVEIVEDVNMMEPHSLALLIGIMTGREWHTGIFNFETEQLHSPCNTYNLYQQAFR
jgi:hypothetical protein